MRREDASSIIILSRISHRNLPITWDGVRVVVLARRRLIGVRPTAARILHPQLWGLEKWREERGGAVGAASFVLVGFAKLGG
jgi:hypothetical protein